MAFDPLTHYSSGLQGCRRDLRADEEFADSILRAGGNPNGDAVAHQWGFAGLGEGKLTATWRHVMEQFPGCWPGPPQGRADCASWGATRCALTSWACELAETKDEKPDISQEGIGNCVISCEAVHWQRGSSDDVWSISEAARAMMCGSGLVVRKPYRRAGVDLTSYSADTAARWGRSKPPTDSLTGRLVLTATNVNGREQVRDFLAAGFGVFFCSSLGWSNNRNEDGVSYPRGDWGRHSQAWIGYDDRPETIRKYREPLVCVLNSFGRWNSGPRKVMGTHLEIPHGAFWTPASTIDHCSGISLSLAAGWPPRSLGNCSEDGHVSFSRSGAGPGSQL